MGQITDIPHRIVNGKPVSSDTMISVYETGTSTPVSLFDDAALTNLVANPFTVTAGNSIPPLYYDFGGEIRVEVADGSGLIFDEDPYDSPAGKLELASPYGGWMVGWQQAGSGSILRQVEAKLEEQLSTADKGAVIDGTTDDSDALIAALDRMAVTGRLHLLSGTYKVTRPLTIPPGIIEGGNIVLDFSNANPANFPNSICVRVIGGPMTRLSNIDTDLAIGDRTFSFASAHTLSQDESFQLSGTVDYAGNSARAYYRKGEMFRVANVDDGTTVQSEMSCRDTYPIADVEVWKRSGDRFTQGCASLTVIGPDSINYVIEFDRLDMTSIDNLRAVGGGYGAISITNCFGISGKNVDARQTASTGGGNSNYGIVVGNSQDVRINGRAYGFFNGFTAGGSGGTGKYVMNRDIHFEGIAGSHPTGGLAGFNLHGNCEYSSGRGVFSNGVVLGGNKNEAHGDFFKTSGYSPVQIAEMHGADFTITGTLRASGPDLPTSTGAVHQSGMGANLRYGGRTAIDLKMYAPNATRIVVFRPSGLTRADVVLDLALDIMEAHPTTRIIAMMRAGSVGNELPLVQFSRWNVINNAVAITWSINANTKLQGMRRQKSVTVTGTGVAIATAPVTFNPAFPRTPLYSVALASNVVTGTVRQVTGFTGGSASGGTVQVSSVDGTNQTFNATVTVTAELNNE